MHSLLYHRAMERSTKSTFLLADSRRAQLKAIAVEHRTTVTELLAEGADMVIEKYRALADREELERRGKQARERMRQGLFEGPGISDRVDEIVYPTRRRTR
jgi:hypothetical protein